MVQTDELKTIIFKRGLSQAKVAKMIGVTPKAFYAKMKRGKFGTDEAEKMIDELHIDDPTYIFFGKK